MKWGGNAVWLCVQAKPEHGGGLASKMWKWCIQADSLSPLDEMLFPACTLTTCVDSLHVTWQVRPLRQGQPVPGQVVDVSSDQQRERRVTTGKAGVVWVQIHGLWHTILWHAWRWHISHHCRVQHGVHQIYICIVGHRSGTHSDLSTHALIWGAAYNLSASFFCVSPGTGNGSFCARPSRWYLQTGLTG